MLESPPCDSRMLRQRRRPVGEGDSSIAPTQGITPLLSRKRISTQYSVDLVRGVLERSRGDLTLIAQQMRLEAALRGRIEG